MNAKDAAQEIRARVGMDEILSLYGYTTRHGFMCCPFHGEREPSLKIYPENGGWHCFGCGKGGSVIDFVMEQEGCNFKTAIIAIDKALHLGLLDGSENPFEASRKKRLQTAIDNFAEAVRSYCDTWLDSITRDMNQSWTRLRRLEDLKHKGEIDKITEDDWMFLAAYDEDTAYDEDRLRMILKFKEEVAEWRRNSRRNL